LEDIVECYENQHRFCGSRDMERTLTENFSRFPSLREIRLNPSVNSKHMPGWNSENQTEALRLYDGHWVRGDLVAAVCPC
jgi:hypothetical protein